MGEQALREGRVVVVGEGDPAPPPGKEYRPAPPPPPERLGWSYLALEVREALVAWRSGNGPGRYRRALLQLRRMCDDELAALPDEGPGGEGVPCRG